MNALDGFARRLFQKALDEDCAGKLLDHLFEGGGVTIDAKTGEIVYLPADQIAQLAQSDKKTMDKWVITGSDGAVQSGYFVGPGAEKAARAVPLSRDETLWYITEIWEPVE